MKVNLRKTIRKAAKAGLMAGSLSGLALVSQGAQAATGQVQVDVSFPPLIILYYYDQISVDVSAAQIATAAGLSGSDSGVEMEAGCDIVTTIGTVGAGSIEASASATTDASGVTNLISFDIDNVWAVRSIATNNLTATLTGTSGEFTNVSSSLAGANVVPGWSFGAGNTGDITFDIDLTTVTDPSSISDTITIAVSP